LLKLGFDETRLTRPHLTPTWRVIFPYLSKPPLYSRKPV